ncbi:MAG: TonB family protein [Saprospiraceae bacterium]|nr:TonB family protein [Saprospiraceae bacterium]
MSDLKETDKATDEAPLDIQQTDWDDIVFRYRNKRYGAYLLRKRYPKHLVGAFFLAVSLLLLVLLFPNIRQLFNDDFEEVEELKYTEVTLTEPLPKPPVVQPVEPEKPKPVKKKPRPNAPPRPKADKAVTEPLSPVVPPDTTKSTNTTESPDTSTAEEPAPTPPPQPEAPPIFAEYNTSQDQVPSFPNGEVAMLRFIYDNIKYPPVAHEKGIEGIVRVSFVIQRNGQITDVKALDSLGGGCTEEAVRIVRKMPNWNPGKIGGRPIRVQQTLPVKFELKD